MPEWAFSLVLVVSSAGMVAGVWLFVVGMRRRELPTTIDGVRVEITAATMHQDMVLEATWRIPVIVSNPSRRPRPVLILERLALVRAGRAHYTATVSTVDDWETLDGGRLILNPGSTVLADVWVTLPAGETPRQLTLRQLRPHQRPIHARFPRVAPVKARSLA